MFFTELKVWSVLLLPSRSVVGSVATLGRGRTFGTAASLVRTGTAGLTLLLLLLLLLLAVASEGMALLVVIAHHHHQQTQSSAWVGKEAAMVERLCP